MEQPQTRIEFSPTGPGDAKVMLVGEAPGKNEVEQGRPFVGASGDLLNELLSSVGIARSECFVTNVCRERLPGNNIEAFIAKRKKDITPHHELVNGKWVDYRIKQGLDLLRKEIELVQPELIIGMGNLALWAISGHWGIKNWRSSELQEKVGNVDFQFIPTYHPAAVFREQSLKPLIAHDLKRAARNRAYGRFVQKPKWNFTIRPTYAVAERVLLDLWSKLERGRVKLSTDIETRAGHIACIGIAWSKFDAICIPLMCTERPAGYWEPREEARLMRLIRACLTHKNAYGIGQNFNYDRQYFERWYGFVPNLNADTMAKHHAIFCNTPKGLGFLSSMYCAYHRYWKDDGRNWDPSMDEEQFWTYNCEDCVRTFEVDEALDNAIQSLTPTWPKLPSVVDFQMRVHRPVFRMMMRGFRHDKATRATMASTLFGYSARIQGELASITGRSLNVRSTSDMQDFFYNQIGATPIKKRKEDGTWGITCDDDALMTLASREPVLIPVVSRIQALRSAGTFMSNYLTMRVDIDGRMRCSFGVPGTVTYRFNSAENAFGSGRNLQNVPPGDDDALIPLPNIRKLFVPDSNRTIFDLDGDSADLRVVTWESDCRQMKSYFAAGVKPYVEIAKEFYRDPTITKHHRSYKFMKALCHGSNYGGQGSGLAHRIGLLVHDVERMQKWYFGMCPEIKAWQDDIRAQIYKRGFIENPFGYRIYFRDRLTRETENEALAWTPQSTVGLIINRAMEQIDAQLPWAELLLQVHDSLTGQYPTHLGDRAKRELIETARVEVPTKSGIMIVPMGVKTSDLSWGDCA